MVLEHLTQSNTKVKKINNIYTINISRLNIVIQNVKLIEVLLERPTSQIYKLYRPTTLLPKKNT